MGHYLLAQGLILGPGVRASPTRQVEEFDLAEDG